MGDTTRIPHINYRSFEVTLPIMADANDLDYHLIS